jgi:glycosyltransferase involved in cell wall biosynthesis
MSYGLACISTKCDSGPKEIITDGVDGLFAEVNDSEDLAKKMLEVLGNNKLKIYLSENAIKKTNDFSKKNIINAWDKSFKRLYK